MKVVPPAILTCQACQTTFLSDPSFYAACNCGPPLHCKHGDVGLAVYRVTCPNAECAQLVESYEEIKNIPVEARRC